MIAELKWEVAKNREGDKVHIYKVVLAITDTSRGQG
jgi:hypothetical protein